MKVVVAATTPDCVAHHALKTEGVAHDVLICRGKYAYATNLARLWEHGEGFVLVEHDVVPWPGAIDFLATCGNDWCRFRYPKGGRLIRSLGCCKFSDGLVRESPKLGASWIGHAWYEVENAMLSAVSELTGGSSCTHSPPVAHLEGAHA